MNNQLIQEKVLAATKNIEKQVDAAIEKIDGLVISDLEQLRKQRMQELKSLQTKKQEWLQSGHGSYEELAEERMFFEAIKKSDNVIIHFFTPTNSRSPIVEKHLKILAPKHLETKIVSLNAEKCPFLAERLKIKIIPTLVCIKKGIMVDKVVGFTTLGNCDDFTTEVLEWRLAQQQVLEYDGDLSVPPDQQVKKEKHTKRTIRDGMYSNQEDDDLEMEDFSEYLQVLNPSTTNTQTELTPEEKLELGIEDDNENTENTT